MKETLKVTGDGFVDCPVCGKTCMLESLYMHGYQAHRMRMREWRERGPYMVDCPMCGRSCRIGGIRAHIGSRHPGYRDGMPEQRTADTRGETGGMPRPDADTRTTIVSYLGRKSCSKCLKPLERVDDRTPYCELRCPDCGAWWPLNRCRLGFEAMPMDDDSWLPDDALDAYDKYCMAREDAVTLLANLERLGCRDALDWREQVREIDFELEDTGRKDWFEDAAEELEALRAAMFDELVLLTLRTPCRPYRPSMRRAAARERDRMRIR
ncbi:hypothetical protein [Bifidobacterium felsineum]|uniref:hypothetical protein n=1 Tax=Bifidobacterium felsineum TaxID=2045440 RepID=UPI001BDD23E6|nr:hypothetical protein [Bifidobacterium felsineum]MBT1164950.1 hypothetical protein [Bifidobacterium felsineum]